MLRAAGAATEPGQIGISRDRLRANFLDSFCIRRLFTGLDFAVRTGLLNTCLYEVFGPNGIWSSDG